MNYSEYVKTFTQMQQDHFNLNQMVNDIKIVRMQQFLGQTEENEQSINLVENYSKLKVKILATASRLKEFFVEHNEEFSYPMFKVSLEFFNGYSLQENVVLMEKRDYQKINKTFLREYKQSLYTFIENKKGQFDKLTEELNKTEKIYGQQIGEPLKNSENMESRATTLKSKYTKDYNQREAISNKLHFMEKEVDLIKYVLETDDEVVK
ncbi:MAG: hypothetical protein CVV59_01255 [Tenericutes bacterium HGW-Tenericutes-4]|jgi:hypothetical protein|nr:MAG: hypothetical protein CVV59_01255 [Tenericutes bacterium HGW-Tenericutes-4]